jgi:hypothetical protein
MLGRLQMDVETCINRYCELSSAVFEPRRSKYNLLARARDLWKVGEAYSSSRLASEVRRIVESIEGNAEAKLINPDTPCKV